MSSQGYSILIPHIFLNISIQKIIDCFEGMKIGKVARLDSLIKRSKDGYEYRMVFIHFEYWNMNNIAAVHLRERIENPNKEARLMYDDPWYWLILPNKSSSQLKNSYNAIDNKIDKLEREISSIYEELFKREYIEEKVIPEWFSECSSSYGQIHPIISLDDMDNLSYSSIDSMNYNTEIDTEIEKMYERVYNANTYIPEDPLHMPPTQVAAKHWMTINICDNA
jgi:hypothetical protein